MICDNGNIDTILAPKCYREKATRQVVITYSKSVFGEDTDSLFLCGKCAKRISNDARKHGYSVTVGGI